MRADRPGRTTIAIAVITAVAFVLQGFGGPHIALQAGFIPARFGAEFPFDAVPFSLTPMTATLLHGGWVHLGFNLLMLVFCGRQVETALGGGRLILLYVIGAYGAALAHYLVEPTTTGPMIGASGAISAVVGSYALMFGKGKVRPIGPVPGVVIRALWLATAWIILQWGVGFTSAGSATPVAIAAHIGGFLTGLAVTYPLLEWRYRYG